MCLFEVALRSELRAGVGELRLTLVLVFSVEFFFFQRATRWRRLAASHVGISAVLEP